MTGRERFLTVLENKKPDRLPCQVHNWMLSYLNTYLPGMDQYQAYDFFGMDCVIYQNPNYIYNKKDLANWQIDLKKGAADPHGNHQWQRIINTPAGMLLEKGVSNKYTSWITDYIIKDEGTFEIWNKYVPLPEKVDWTPVIEAKKKIGDKGIVRASFFDFGQGSPWQSFVSKMYDLEKGIMATFDKPDWLHYILKSLLQKKLAVIERAGELKLDLVETGGGAGSSTVISPEVHKNYCLYYDRIQHQAFHAAGVKVVYHLCGGLMPLLEIVAENGADGLETMTPPSMGGDCDLAAANERIGDRLFFIGGFDQNQGFEQGNPKIIKEMVYSLHAACLDGGYICSPSDHFFLGDPVNIKAFVESVKECLY